MLKNHVFAYFARVQMCFSSFERKLVCVHSSKSKFLLNFNFCIAVIMLYLYKIKEILNLLFFAKTLTLTNTLDVRL